LIDCASVSMPRSTELSSVVLIPLPDDAVEAG
jgi:hypothetical protein